MTDEGSEPIQPASDSPKASEGVVGREGLTAASAALGAAKSTNGDGRGPAETASSDVATINRLLREAEAAKSACDQRVAELSNMLSAQQSTLTQMSEAAGQASASAERVRADAASSAEGAARIEGLKAKVEQAAEVAAQRSQHIEEGRQYVDKSRVEFDTLLNAARQSASAVQSQQEATRVASEQLVAVAASAQAAKSAIETTVSETKALLTRCASHEASTKSAAESAQSIERRLGEHEARLTELQRVATERLKTIEALLPGATSAGLASAFNQRRSQLKWPQRIWQGVFLLSIIALLALAAVEFSVFAEATRPITWDDLGLSLLYRVPFALPLIWLAIHANQQAALAQRVEEDYAFKETVSRSFEGYRREMSELEGRTGPNSALTQLCGGVLGVITSPPGRIYEKHPLTNTPLSAVADSAESIGKAASRIPRLPGT